MIISIEFLNFVCVLLVVLCVVAKANEQCDLNDFVVWSIRLCLLRCSVVGRRGASSTFDPFLSFLILL